MAKNKKSYFNIPKVIIDFSKVRSMSEEEMECRCKKVESKSKIDWRKFVEEIENHPERLVSWEADISFPEFAERVKAGEYD